MTTRTLTYFSFPTELDIMLALAIRNTSKDIDGFDTEYFNALVEKNRIEPLIAEGVKKLPPEAFEKYPIFKSLMAKQNKFSLFTMRQMHTLASLINGFENQGIRAISIKGPLLAIELYGNPALRFSRDLDILVSEEDFPAACKYLESLGYTEEITVLNKTPKRRKKLAAKGEELHTEFKKDGICVELHWRSSFRIDESFDALWERRDTRKLLGQNVPVLSKNDNLIYLICHAAGHGYIRLRWLLDLYEILKDPKMPFDELYNAFSQRGMSAIFFETLMLLYRCSIFQMPEIQTKLFAIRHKEGCIEISYSDQLEADIKSAMKLVDTLYPLLINATDAGGITDRAYKYLLPKQSQKKSLVRTILGIFEPCRADLELIDLPDPLYFLYYFIRPFHKLYRLMRFYKK